MRRAIQGDQRQLAFSQQETFVDSHGAGSDVLHIADSERSDNRTDDDTDEPLPTTIRRLNEGDKEELLAFLMRHAQEHEYFKQFVFSVPAAEQVFNYCGSSKFGLLLGVFQKGTLVGVFAAYTTNLVFSEQTVAQDFVFYISPQTVDRTKVARSIIQVYKGWARRLGVGLVRLGVTRGPEQAAAIAFARMQGFDPVAIIYEMRV